jgi:uncharacterized RDD family membrane protein YckC
MKTPARHLLLNALLALFLGLNPGLRAEENSAPPPPAANDQPAVAPESPPAPNSPANVEKKSELRRLDVTPSEAGVEESKNGGEPGDDHELTNQEEPPTKPDSTPAPAPATDSKQDRHKKTHSYSHQHNGNARVSVWNNSTLAEGESADAVVSILGSSTSAGRVGDAVVSIFGSSTSSGEVGGGVVSILGSSRATAGTVGDVVVSIVGSSYVNARVKGDVVAVLGNVELGPDAVVDGDIVCVGGSVKQHPKAVVHGDVNHVAIGGHLGDFEGLHAWVAECLMYARPLAFGPNLMWAWWIAIGFLALYVLIAALFPRSVEKCLETFEQRPGYSLLTAVLVTIITPFAAIPLLVTVVGIPALLIAGLFGKLVMIAWIGRRITKLMGEGPFARPAMAVLIGGVIVLGLYTVPVVGFVVAKLLSWLGLGVVVYTIILGMKRNRAVPPAVIPPVVATTPATESVGITAPFETAAPVAETPAAPMGPVAPILVSAVTLHRAGFWIRIAASVLDALLVGLAIGLLPHLFRPNFLLAYAAYCVVLWGLRGTTVGGIVCNLKVVRLDDRRVDWATALVRGLGGFLSFFAAGIGFIWVAFDDQRQSWHDKIAGTTIVHVPKGVSLV